MSMTLNPKTLNSETLGMSMTLNPKLWNPWHEHDSLYESVVQYAYSTCHTVPFSIHGMVPPCWCHGNFTSPHSM
jgi:hypothetical protein